MELRPRTPDNTWGTTEPIKSHDRHGRDWPDYSMDGVMALHALLGQAEKKFDEDLPETFWQETGYQLFSLDDLLRAVNGYELSDNYRSRLEHAVHDTAVFDSWREDISCRPQNMAAGSDLVGWLEECRNLSARSLIHNDLLRVDFYATFSRAICLEPVLTEAEEGGDRYDMLDAEKHRLYQETTFGILGSDADELRKWVGWLTATFSTGERPRRAYKEPYNSLRPGHFNPRTGWQPVDSHLPSRSVPVEDYLPTPILMARQWVYEHYTEATRQYKDAYSVNLSECWSMLPGLVETAHASLAQTEQQLLVTEFDPGPYGYRSDRTRKMMSENSVEHIEEVYRRLDPFEPTFGKRVAVDYPD
ncbi:hypothetical protein F4X86_00080 [Candidatus Saccharibacteria bacterium]|nr:hypothetical protein [Candidatus Saccharibacteria bacterium]